MALLAPLAELTGGKSESEVDWTTEMSIAFNSIREEMVKDIELSYPDFSESAAKLELSVDASGVGAGACLTQVQDGEEKIISFASMKFSPTQKRYSTIERELVALRWGIKYFKVFLYGSPFILHTDHKPLMYLHNMKMIDNRLARTLEDIAEFTFEIKYRPGRLNTLADALSRVSGTIEEERLTVEASNEVPIGLTLAKEVRGGGDSLFESLFILLSEIPLGRSTILPRDHYELRSQLVSEVLENIKQYRPTAKATDLKCFKAMRQPGIFPVNDVIVAASKIYSLRIWVHYGMSSPVVYCFNTGKVEDLPCNRIHLQCVSGVHYNPLRPMKTDIPSGWQ